MRSNDNNDNIENDDDDDGMMMIVSSSSTTQQPTYPAGKYNATVDKEFFRQLWSSWTATKGPSSTFPPTLHLSSVQPPPLPFPHVSAPFSSSSPSSPSTDMKGQRLGNEEQDDDDGGDKPDAEIAILQKAEKLSWWLAAHLPVPHSVKKLYLECTDPKERLRRQYAFLLAKLSAITVLGVYPAIRRGGDSGE